MGTGRCVEKDFLKDRHRKHSRAREAGLEHGSRWLLGKGRRGTGPLTPDLGLSPKRCAGLSSRLFVSLGSCVATTCLELPEQHRLRATVIQAEADLRRSVSSPPSKAHREMDTRLLHPSGPPRK